MNGKSPGKPVLVTGASGYVGGRLVPRLLARGGSVRVVARSPGKLAIRPWAGDPRVEVIGGDLGDPGCRERALRGVGAAYYLIHSMVSAPQGFRETDLRLAGEFSADAAGAGVERIVYLGGLGETGDRLSEHLASRREVEDALRAGGVPVTVFRAAMILGSGSASFEILRYLVERLPVMVTPRWVNTECQPIAVDDVLHYLIAALDVPATAGRTFDVGGPDILRYRDLMEITARELGLRKRVVVPVPVLTPTLSSLWIHLVTPVSHRIARPLAEGLRNRVVCRDDAARRLMPHRLVPIGDAVRAAVAGEGLEETSWLDAGRIPGDPDWAGGTVYADRRRREIPASPERVFAAFSRIGGKEGWFRGSWIWKLRGGMDRMVGGPGMARGRRRPNDLWFGDVVDCWRVVALEPGRRLGLRAEMRLPGEGSLEFEVQGVRGGGSVLVQTARFKPRGLGGIVYWQCLRPGHAVVFRNMISGIAARAVRDERDAGLASASGARPR